MTPAPSRIACCTAAATSDAKQAPLSQTLYTASQAPGATPVTVPRGMPSGLAVAPDEPTAVVAVCVPCPSESRAVSNRPGPRMARLVARKAWPEISLLLQLNG